MCSWYLIQQGRLLRLVPQPALQRGNDGGAYVWLIGEGDKVQQRPVTVRRAVGDSWLVTDGLAAGDRLVVDGLQRVRPDAQVTPVALDQKDAPAAQQQQGGAAG